MTWQSDTERAIRGAVLAVAAVLFAATVWLMCALRDVRDGLKRRIARW